MPEYYLNYATGNDTTGDGLGEGTAWKTLTKAEATVVAGDKVWVKADTPYLETWTWTRAGTNGSGAVMFEGYTTTIGDGGQATIDGQSTRATCITSAAARLNRVTKNFNCIGATGNPCTMSSVTGSLWINCSFTGGTGSGLVTSTDTHVSHCRSSGSTTYGMSCPNGVSIGNRVSNNGNRGFNNSTAGNHIHIFDEFVVAGASQPGLYSAGSTASNTVVLNCLFDGQNLTNRRSWQFDGHVNGVTSINNIFANSTYAFLCGSSAQDSSRVSIVRRSMMSSITISKYANGWAGDARAYVTNQEINAAPTWVNAAAFDFTPLSDASPQVHAGIDAGTNMDIGSRQRKTSFGGVGSSAVMRPKILDGGNTT